MAVRKLVYVCRANIYSVVVFPGRTMSGFSLTPRQLVQAKEAIEMLSSLSSAERPGTSGVGRASSTTSSTSTSTLSTAQASLGTSQPSSSRTWTGSEARAEGMLLGMLRELHAWVII